MNNFWGEPDDIEPLPDWMDPVKCRQMNESKEKRKVINNTVEKAAESCLKRPPILTKGWTYNGQ